MSDTRPIDLPETDVFEAQLVLKNGWIYTRMPSGHVTVHPQKGLALAAVDAEHALLALKNAVRGGEVSLEEAEPFTAALEAEIAAEARPDAEAEGQAPRGLR